MQVLASLTERLTFVFLLCEEDAKEQEITVDDFESRLYGEKIANEASYAFLAECEAFFRRLGQIAMAEMTKNSIASMRSGQARLDKMIEDGQLDSLLAKAEGEMEKMLQSSDGVGLPN